MVQTGFTSQGVKKGKEHMGHGGFQVWDILKTNSQLNTIKRNHNRAAFDKKLHMFIFVAFKIQNRRSVDKDSISEAR